MKAKDVILQLTERLPLYTDKFSVDIVVSSITSTGLVATATTTTNHGLSANDAVNIRDIETPSNILTITRTGTVLYVETVENHDLTLDYQQTVEIIGANEAEFNGTFELIDVQNRRNFKLTTVDSGATVGTGTIQSIDIAVTKYPGFYAVVDVLSANIFTYALPAAIPVDSNGGGVVSVGFRISGAASLVRALDSYTKKNSDEYWLFVVLGNVTASKDRNISSDAVAIQSAGTEWKQQIIQPFAIHLFAPASDSLSSRDIRDDMEDMARNLFRSVLNVKFDSYLAQEAHYKTIFDGHGFQQYNSAVYIHTFNFQTVSDITFEDTIGEPENVAFRDIDFNMITNLMTDDTETMQSNINLDDEPLP